MELNFAQQSLAFGLSIILGLSLGVFYGIIKFLRVAFSFGKVGIFVADLVFMIISAFVIFLFSLAYIRGFVRVYVILGTTIGVVVQRLTIGRLCSKIYLPIIRVTKKIILTIFEKIKKIIKSLLKFAHNILYNKSGKLNHNEKVSKTDIQ